MYSSEQSGPGVKWAAVTKSDNTVLAAGMRGIFVGTGGDLAIVGEDGNDEIFKNILSGTLLPVGAKKVLSTGTTAADIVAIY